MRKRRRQLYRERKTGKQNPHHYLLANRRLQRVVSIRQRRQLSWHALIPRCRERVEVCESRAAGVEVEEGRGGGEEGGGEEGEDGVEEHRVSVRESGERRVKRVSKVRGRREREERRKRGR